jgi:hypothetical protein
MAFSPWRILATTNYQGVGKAARFAAKLLGKAFPRRTTPMSDVRIGGRVFRDPAQRSRGRIAGRILPLSLSDRPAAVMSKAGTNCRVTTPAA